MLSLAIKADRTFYVARKKLRSRWKDWKLETLESRAMLAAFVPAEIQWNSDLQLAAERLIEQALVDGPPTDWVIGVAETADPTELAATYTLANPEPTGIISNTYVVRLPNQGTLSAASVPADELAENLISIDGINFAFPLVEREYSKRLIPNDPRFSEQWHLRNTGQRGGASGEDVSIETAWDSANGNGVVIAIVDDGLEHSHTDLTANYRADLSFDFNNNDPDPTPDSNVDDHGTSVAGVAAATGNNFVGVTGAAFAADLAGIRLISDFVTDQTEANGLGFQSDSIDIYNNSWGPSDDGDVIEGPGPLTLATLELGATNGRGGLGNIYTWAAGNGGTSDYANFDGYASSRYTIAVAAVDDRGRTPFYGEPGASVLISAPSDGRAGITTTDINGGYTSNFGGTSSAAPLAAGVIGLALEANPSLTWRDVQHLLVQTARKNDPSHTDWETSSAGHDINHFYGFGVIDAAALISAAGSWTNVPPEISASSGVINVGASIPDDSTTGISSTFTVTDSIKLEAVEVVIDAAHARRGDLEVVLTSPGGTESVIAAPRAFDANRDLQWTFTTVRHWDELSQGDWTVTVRDLSAGNTGSFDSWELKLFGTPGAEVEGEISNFEARPPLGSQVYEASVFGEIDSIGDTDTFTVDLSAGNTLSLGLTPEASLSPNVTIISPLGGTVTSKSAAAGDSIVIQSIPIIQAGVYRIEVNGSMAGTYTLDLILNSTIEEESYGVGDNYAIPQFLGNAPSFNELDRQAVSGTLSTNSDEDWYWFQSAPGDYLTLAASSVSGLGGFSLELYDAGSNLLAIADDSAANVELLIDDFLNSSSLAPATYYARLVPTGERNQVDYSLLVTRNITVDREPDSRVNGSPQRLLNPNRKAIGYVALGSTASTSEVEPNDDGRSGGSVDDLLLANDIQGNFQPSGPNTYDVVVNGTISSGNDQDWDFFRIHAQPGDEITISLTGNSLSDPYLRFYDRNGQQIAFDDDGGPGLDSEINFDTFSYSGDYFIVADSFSSRTGTYTLAATLTTSDLLQESGVGDRYEIALIAGTPIEVTATIPASGSGYFANALEPLVELYDSVGNLLATGNGALSHTSAVDGLFVVSVRDTGNANEGEYALTVSGTGPSPELLGPSVVAIVPDDQEVIGNNFPTITFSFDQPLRLDSLGSNVLIDASIPGTVVANSSTSFTITPDSPLADGPHTLQLNSGAVTNLQGISNLPFESTFSVDTAGPRVIGTSLQQDDVVSEGTLSIVLGFDEPLDESALDESDVTLTGQAHPPVIADELVYDSQSWTVTIRFDGLRDDFYRLEVDSSEVGFRDQLGNALDGETIAFPLPPHVSGDGQPGGDFIVDFEVDMGERRVAEPERLYPLGSLIFESQGNVAALGGPTDSDTFLIDLEAGETLVAIAEPVNPAATLSLTIPGIANTVSAPGPGEKVVLPLEIIETAGTVGVEVSGDISTGFTIAYLINADAEFGAADSSFTTPLSLDRSRLAVGGGRYAAVGELPNGQPGTTDTYTVDLSGSVGTALDIVLAPIGGQSLDASFQLLDPLGGVIANSSATTSTGQEDHRISLAPISTGGVHAIRVTSGNIGGRYDLSIYDGLMIDTEPNDSGGDTLRTLANNREAIGFLGGADSLASDASGGEDHTNHDEFEYIGTLPPRTFITATQESSGVRSIDRLDAALHFLTQNASSFGLNPDKVAELKVTDQFVSSHTGVTHFHFVQVHDGLPVLNATFNVNVSSAGQVVSAGGGAVSGLKTSAEGRFPEPLISSSDALAELLSAVGVVNVGLIEQAATVPERDYRTTLRAEKVVRQNVPVSLVYAPTTAGGVELAWSLNVDLQDSDHWFDAAVSAISGEVLFLNDWVSHASYNVFALPLESPNFGSRSLSTDPHDSLASPFGWHDTDGSVGAEQTITQGNNVNAYLDRDDDDAPDSGSQPDGGAGLTFDFPVDLSQAPDAYQPAAVTNLFYWNNVIHDVLYQYGFDEPAGNFQVNNYNNGGAGNDAVQAEAQDGADVGKFNNANFATPPDGSMPRMQMFLWDETAPHRDGDFDNGIIVHEYGHGVSNRLTGGPGNASALFGAQSGGMGEGWSDWLALMFSQRVGDSATDGRGIGTYALGEPANGSGIRTQKYSYDMSVNDLTYGRISTAAIPHGVGEVWNSALWDLNWLLIEGSNLDSRLPPGMGFDSDLYGGSGGNNVALQLVLDGMKLQPANPTFIQARDAILEADQLAFGGAHQEHIWLAFARRGMGFSADDGGSADTVVVTEAFDLPADSSGVVEFNKQYYELGDTVEIVIRDSDLEDAGSAVVTVTSASGDSETVSLASQGFGVFRGEISVAAGTAVADGVLQAGTNQKIVARYDDADNGSGTAETVTDNAWIVEIQRFVDFDFSDSGGNPFDEGFTLSGVDSQWHLSTGRGNDSGHSAVDSFYFGNGEGPNGGGEYTNDQLGTLTSPLIDLAPASAPLTLTFNHFLDTEPGFDEARVTVIDGSDRTLLLSNFESTLPNETGGFVQQSVDLSDFVGRQIQIEFAFETDFSVVNEGWYVDDVVISAVQLDPGLKGPRVTTIDPPSGGTTDLDIAIVTVQFDEPIDTTTAANTANYELLHAGPNGIFEAGGDDTLIPFVPNLISPTQVTLAIDSGFIGLPPGDYRLTIEGDDPTSFIADVDGNPLGGAFGPGSGEDFVHEFTVVLDTSAGIDRYEIELQQGDELTLTTSTPFDGATTQPANTLDPRLVLMRRNGSVVAADADSADGKNATLTFLANEPATYQVLVVNEGGIGEYVLTADVISTVGQVVDRHLFYNDSAFDGFDPSITPADNNSLASDLVALRPGGTGTAANISSFVQGINGVAVDVENLADPMALDANDFVFRVGNDNEFGNWQQAPEPLAVEVSELGAGSGLHRIFVTWPVGAITNTWLEVSLLASQDTGLLTDDLFYFASAPGDSDGNGRVDAIDFASARSDPRNFLSPATIVNDHDFNRDRRVNAADWLIVRDHTTEVNNHLAMIQPPAGALKSSGVESKRQIDSDQPLNVDAIDAAFSTDDWLS